MVDKWKITWQNVCWDINRKYPTIYSAHLPKLANYLGYFWKKLISCPLPMLSRYAIVDSWYIIFMGIQGAGIGNSGQPPGLTNYHNLTVNNRWIYEALSFKFLQRKGKEVLVDLPRKNLSDVSKLGSSIYKWVRQWIKKIRKLYSNTFCLWKNL